MSYGLQVRNAANELVIDDTFANHALAAAGTASVSTYGPWPTAAAARVALPSPVAMSRCPLVWGRAAVAGRYCGLAGYEINGSNELAAFYLVRAGSDPNPSAIDWRVTATPAAPSAETYGLRVYDGAGALVFDSGLSYLRIADVSASFDPTDSGDLITHSAIAAPYYCLSAVAYLRTVSPSGDDESWEAAMVARQSDTSARVALMSYAYQGGSIAWIGVGGGFQEVRLILAHP